VKAADIEDGHDQGAQEEYAIDRQPDAIPSFRAWTRLLTLSEQGWILPKDREPCQKEESYIDPDKCPDRWQIPAPCQESRPDYKQGDSNKALEQSLEA
jgi:hypothetical protein